MTKKLCINCMHSVPGTYSLGCSLPDSRTGEDIRNLCTSERSFGALLVGGCGPWGRFYLPKSLSEIVK